MPQSTCNHAAQSAVNLRFKFLSLIGIMAVVCDHIGSNALAPDRLFVYGSYHMPLFVFISGYFFRPPDTPKQAAVKIVSKLKKHLLPLACWTGVYMLLFSLIRSYTSIPAKMGYDTFKITRVFIDPFLWGTDVSGLSPAVNIAAWFLGAFIIIEVFNSAFYSFLPSKQKNNLHVFVFFVVLAVVAGNYSKLERFISDKPYSVILTRTIYLLFWYNVGYYYRLYFEKWEQKVPDALMISVTIIGYLLISCSRFLRNMSMVTSVYSGVFEASFSETVFIAAIGILFWLRISKYAEPIMKMTRLPKYIADHTFDIMMHHGFCFWLINLAIYFLSLNHVSVAEKFNYEVFAITPWYAFVPGTTLAPIRLVYIAFALALPLSVRWLYEKAKKKVCDKMENAETQRA